MRSHARYTVRSPIPVAVLLWVGPIAMILCWALVATAIVFLIRYLARQSRSSANDSLALAILKERYAKGEIGKEEFDQKRKDLL